MKYYVVGQLTITEKSWVSDYANCVTKLVEQFGGRYLARTSKFEILEGARNSPGLFVIIEWPSKEAAETFYQSENYKPHLRARLKGAINEMVLVAGEDITALARI